MTSSTNIRNISVIAHVDHGKSTLTDSLVGAAGIISHSAIGNKRYMDTRPDEIEKGITIKSTAISLMFPYKEQEYLINLIDSPGHVDFSSEVTAALRVTDGAMVVVDSVEGCRSQTETVLRQALQERIVPVLMINKLDRAIVELQLDPEECYQNLLRIVESVNVIISTYTDHSLGYSFEVSPVKGNVAIGAGKMGWAFTLRRFAKMYASKFKIAEDKVLKKLWGDWFFCPDSNKWQKDRISKKTGKTLKRGFCQFVLEPIFNLFKVVNNNDLIQLDTMLSALDVRLTTQEREAPSKELMKNVMQKFLPAHEALIELIVDRLPSPKTAQKYRYSLLYTGPTDDKYATAIRDCDENGPLMVYVSKMVPSEGSGGKFVAFGRVFSGTLKQGHKVRIMGPQYEATTQSKADVYKGSVQRLLVMMGRVTRSVDEIQCGNCIGMVGLDNAIVKTGTVTDLECTDAHPFKNMKYSVSPVVQIAVETEKASDIGKLVEGLKKLTKSDPLLQCTISETGQHIMAGAGELHLDICFGDLENQYCKGIKLLKSKPVVTFKETVTQMSDICLSKSANKHNRLYMQALPIDEQMSLDLENNILNPSLMDSKTLSKHIVDTYQGWDANSAKKIWCFGPADCGPNVVVDCTKSTDFMNEIKESVVSSFQWASKEGGLCEESMRGVRFNVIDAVLHADAIHRGGGQLIPAARKAYYSSQLSAQPRLVEPMYKVEIQTVDNALGGIYNVVNKRKGMILATEQTVGTLYTVTCHIPVLESFGLTEELRAATSGQAFPQCSFDHWRTMNSNPYEKDTIAHKIATEIRVRKGLKPEIPTAMLYLDKL